MKNIEPVALNPLVESGVEKMICVIRGKQVLLDRDLALLYGVETKRIKFSHPVMPDAPMTLIITCDGNKFQFNYCDESGREYSRGTFFSKETL